MRIATWNVNSLKVRLPHVLDWLAQQAEAGAPVDILCLQELKLPDQNFPLAEISAAGYHACFVGQKTYNGVAILSRNTLPEPADIQRNIPGYADLQQRVIAATFPSREGPPIRIISAYFPNGQAPGTDKFAYKLEWLHRFTRWLDREMIRYPRLALLGDFNIAPEDTDVHDPAKWEGENLVSPEERAAFEAIRSLGLKDAYRLFAQPEKSFSWWDYRYYAFRRNAGLRIDHIMLTRDLASACSACTIDKATRGWEQPSDHAPVVASLYI